MDQNGEPQFVASDIAKVLGYERLNKAIQDHVDMEDKAEVPIQDFSSNQNEELWSVASDITKTLGYRDVINMIRNIIDPRDKGTR